MCGFQSRRWRGQGQATATFHREPSSQHWRYTERAPQLEVDLAVLWGSCHSAECQSGFSLAPAAGQEERKDERGQWARALQCHLAGGAWPGHRIAASPLAQPPPARPGIHAAPHTCQYAAPDRLGFPLVQCRLCRSSCRCRLALCPSCSVPTCCLVLLQVFLDSLLRLLQLAGLAFNLVGLCYSFNRGTELLCQLSRLLHCLSLFCKGYTAWPHDESGLYDGAALGIVFSNAQRSSQRRPLPGVR